MPKKEEHSVVDSTVVSAAVAAAVCVAGCVARLLRARITTRALLGKAVGDTAMVNAAEVEVIAVRAPDPPAA